MRVFLESAPENYIPQLGLDVEGLADGTRDGWLRPHATAESFGRFLDAWRANDPNGIWGYVTEVGDVLVCSRIDDDIPVGEFPRVGTTSDGSAVYDLSGWNWVIGDSELS